VKQNLPKLEEKALEQAIGAKLLLERASMLDMPVEAADIDAEVAKVIAQVGGEENYRKALEAQGVTRVDGILLDIGVSSHQLDEPTRGFSYHADAPLDMRMSQSGPTAADLVNTADERELANILWQYGEEKFSRQIARAIVRAREKQPIATTFELVDIITSAIPAAARRDKHPARRVFQALRIAVNRELDVLSGGLDAAFDLLGEGGRLAVITFHSLEDRMVKQRFNEWRVGCNCPSSFPVCVCGRTPAAELVLRHPAEASEQELEENPRARSAKLRCVRKLHERYI
jgi:16S rRNA (cytosine1402-N4)-methyltransferase